MDIKRAEHRPRVVVAKIGLDGHNRGAYVVAHGLRQAGMEVIYTGIRQSPSVVAGTAVEESADVIGISSMVGAHLSLVKKLKKELDRLNAADIPVIMGGIIPEEDYEPLIRHGVTKIFPSGTEINEIVHYIHALLEGPRWVAEVPGSLAGEYPNDLHLQGSRCERCGNTYFPERKNCPRCLDNAPLKPVKLSDEGRLQTFVVAGVAPPGYDVPHAQGYIDLKDNGPRIFSLLTDIGDGSGLKTGARMALKTLERGKDAEDRAVMGYRFRPLE